MPSIEDPKGGKDFLLRRITGIKIAKRPLGCAMDKTTMVIARSWLLISVSLVALVGCKIIALTEARDAEGAAVPTEECSVPNLPATCVNGTRCDADKPICCADYEMAEGFCAATEEACIDAQQLAYHCNAPRDCGSCLCCLGASGASCAPECPITGNVTPLCEATKDCPTFEQLGVSGVSCVLQGASTMGHCVYE